MELEAIRLGILRMITDEANLIWRTFSLWYKTPLALTVLLLVHSRGILIGVGIGMSLFATWNALVFTEVIK